MKRNAMSFVTTTAGRVFCEERGSGVPVVLLHATLHDHRDFDLVAGPLATRYRTIAVDWPGHGRSDPPGRGGAADALRAAAVPAARVGGPGPPPPVPPATTRGRVAAPPRALAQPAPPPGLIPA